MCFAFGPANRIESNRIETNQFVLFKGAHGHGTVRFMKRGKCASHKNVVHQYIYGREPSLAGLSPTRTLKVFTMGPTFGSTTHFTLHTIGRHGAILKSSTIDCDANSNSRSTP